MAEAINMAKLIESIVCAVPHYSDARIWYIWYVFYSFFNLVYPWKYARKYNPWKRSIYFFHPNLGYMLKFCKNYEIRSSRPQIKYSTLMSIPKQTPKTTWLRLCAPRYILENATKKMSNDDPPKAYTLPIFGKYLKNNKKIKIVANQLCPEGFPNSPGQ